MSLLDPNAKTLSITIKCLNCGGKFPSPIFMSPYSSFNTSNLFGNMAQCHHCRKMTGCNKENFVARFEGGGFLGNEAI
jgi:hypothetical protein